MEGECTPQQLLSSILAAERGASPPCRSHTTRRSTGQLLGWHNSTNLTTPVGKHTESPQTTLCVRLSFDSGCGSIDHRPEEDGHSQEAGRFVPDDEDLDFYGPPSLVLPPGSMPGLPPPLPPPSSLAHWDPPPQKLHSAEPSSISESPPNLPPIPTVPYSPLFGIYTIALNHHEDVRDDYRVAPY